MRRRGVRGVRAERRADDRAPEPEDARARERRWGGDPERAVGRNSRRPDLARVPKTETRDDAAPFVPSAGAGCTVTETEAKLAGLAREDGEFHDEDDHHDEAKHDDHDAKAKHDDHHDEAKQKKPIGHEE